MFYKKCNLTLFTLVIALTVLFVSNLQTLSAAIVEQWTFNEGTGSIANSTGSVGRYGQIVGATWTTTPGGSGLVFHQTGTEPTYVWIHNSFEDNLYSGLTAITVEAWVNIPTYNPGLSDYASIISVRQTDSLMFCLYNGTPMNYANMFDTSPQMSLNTWHHIVYVAEGISDGTDPGIRERVYLDGVETNNQASVWIGISYPMSGYGMNIGGNQWSSRSEKLEGTIDEVTIHDVALNDSAILARYNAGPVTPAEPNLVEQWTFNEGQGNVANSTGYVGRYGDVVGATWTTTPGGSGLVFHQTGTDPTYVWIHRSYEDNLYSGLTAITVEAWVNIPTYNPGLADYASIISVRKTDSLMFCLYNGTPMNYANMFDTSPQMSLNTWHHIVYVAEGVGTGRERVYLDGAETNNQPSAWIGIVYAPTGYGMNIGGNQWSSRSEKLEGTIDEVRIWDGAMSVSQVVSSYNAGPTPFPCGSQWNPKPLGDLSNPPDCAVNFEDMAVLASQWLKCSDPQVVGCTDVNP